MNIIKLIKKNIKKERLLNQWIVGAFIIVLKVKIKLKKIKSRKILMNSLNSMKKMAFKENFQKKKK